MAADELNIRRWVKATKPETRPLPMLVTCEACGHEWPGYAVACCPTCGRVICAHCGREGGCLACRPQDAL